MKTHYVSRYLNIYPSKRNSSILFHGVSGCIDEVDSCLGHDLKSAQSKNLPLAKKNLSLDILNFLEQRGHITTQSADEEWHSFRKYVEKLHQEINQARKKKGKLMLVPSYYCNLACFYCYQNPMRAQEGSNATNVMTPELVDVIFSNVLKRLYPGISRTSDIEIDLYGGEPFLERNRQALERIFSYTKDYQIPVTAISNATSLESYLDFFGIEPGLVNALQISFDGNKLQHDQSRITHYGGGTFDVIIANIHRLLDRGVIIRIRVNTNKNTVDSLKLLWKNLEEEEISSHPNVRPYAQAIHNHFDQTSHEPLFSRAALARKMEASDVGFESPLDVKLSPLAPVFDAENGIPLRRTNFCMQNMPNAFLIDHRRDIYGCYEEAGNRRLIVGSFDEEGKVSLNNRYEMYQSRNVGMYEPCSKCPVALTCGGGCAIAARGSNWNSGTIFTNYCDSHKELVAMAVQKLFQRKVEGLKTAVREEESWITEQPYL